MARAVPTTLPDTLERVPSARAPYPDVDLLDPPAGCRRLDQQLERVAEATIRHAEVEQVVAPAHAHRRDVVHRHARCRPQPPGHQRRSGPRVPWPDAAAFGPAAPDRNGGAGEHPIP
jgi:hypothetical protein